MPTPVLATKLYIPPPRAKIVLRSRLITRLNEGLHRKLVLISAPAGFGKTTLVSEWATQSERPVAWLSLDEGDSDPTRFLTYLVAALQTVAPKVGEGVLTALRSPQPPPPEALLTALLNDITTIPEALLLVLDDYHQIEAQTVDRAVTFLLEHLPPHMHLVMTTREDPGLPLARLRARGQLTELRAADLRFTPSEAAEFLREVMHLNLSEEDITALEKRTEGWIAGLQLAALSMQGRQDVSHFIHSFTSSHRFVLDYLMEEVLHQQPERIQAFLLRTSILDRLCGPLCDALLQDPSTPGQEMLTHLERANLFIVPLDHERRWYRYHHLFAELLRQRLHQNTASLTQEAQEHVAALHLRASMWYEANGLDIEAFQHAVAAKDIDRATHLVEGEGMPLIFRGAATPILNWLESLPKVVLDARPSLWVIYASALLFVGQMSSVEQKLQAAERALQGTEPDDQTHDLIGHIAAIRATLAVAQHQPETIIAQSRRALAYLHPSNLPVRTATTWTLGHAYHLQGDRAAASQAYTEAVSTSQAIGHFIITIAATLGLGSLQAEDNQLYLAAETYRRVLKGAGDPPPPIVCEAHLGLGRIFYEWNDLDAAERHGQQSLHLARQLENTDRAVACEVFLARLRLARDDGVGAATILDRASQLARQHGFEHQMPELAATQVLVYIKQGNLTAAAQRAQAHELPLSQARVHLAQGDPSAALAALEPWRQQVEAKGWADEQLKVMILQAVALHAHGEKERAVQLLNDALALAEPGGFIRIFVDEGKPMAQLLSGAAAHGVKPDYAGKLLAVFSAEGPLNEASPPRHAPLPVHVLIEPLSERELEVLRLVAQGLSNEEISKRLFRALSTIKGHNRIIFDKLQVKSRTEAVARARQLGLL
jgi:LuxR family maltose regulon positive regulatory protein